MFLYIHSKIHNENPFCIILLMKLGLYLSFCLLAVGIIVVPECTLDRASLVWMVGWPYLGDLVKAVILDPLRRDHE